MARMARIREGCALIPLGRTASRLGSQRSRDLSGQLESGGDSLLKWLLRAGTARGPHLGLARALAFPEPFSNEKMHNGLMCNAY